MPVLGKISIIAQKDLHSYNLHILKCHCLALYQCVLIQCHILAHACAGEDKHYSSKRFKLIGPAYFEMSLSCLVPVCADSMSHISTCLCWEGEAL